MKNRSKLALAMALCGVVVFAQRAHGITVTPTSDASVLATKIKGSGVTINSSSYDGAAVAVGTFTGGVASGIGMEDGIVLTTGSAASVSGLSNTNAATETVNNTGHSPLLETLFSFPPTLPDVYHTRDAAVLTLNFTFDGGDLFFNYVFGSEEYLEFAPSIWNSDNAYNDVFGMFLSSSTMTTPANLALIPGTSNPVSINTVNKISNSEYFKNNDYFTDLDLDGPPASPPYPFEYDGFTTMLTATYAGLAPGDYTLTIAIADVGDGLHDSGVFIQAGTLANVFTAPPPPGVPDGGETLFLLGLAFAGLRGLGVRK